MSKLTRYTVLRRVAIPFLLVMVVATLLWFSSPSPVEALTINFPTLPTTGNLGLTYSFTMQVTVEDRDLLPIAGINMEMRSVANPTYVATCNDLPLNNGTKTYTDAQTRGGAVTVTTTTGPNWGWAYGPDRWGYGYRDPEGAGRHDFVGGYGYGYMLGYKQGTVSITYSVSWTPPSTWPQGNYGVKVFVYGDGTKKFSGTSTAFSLTLPSGGGGGGGGGGGSSVPGVTLLTPYMDFDGVFNVSATAKSEDGNVQLTINKGTKATSRDGSRLSQVSILKMTDPPAPPADTTVIGLVYDIGPDGATFDPPITLTFTYDPAQVPTGIDQKKLVIATWDSAAGKWVEFQNCTVDTAAHTISVQISHFTPFATIAHTRPAAFAVSGLTISPAQADTGQAVTVSVQVANNGDLAGSYTLTLKVNNVAVATRDITVAGSTTQTVQFTVTQDAGGTYNVDVNGLTGTFTVKPAAIPAIFTASTLNISPAAAEVGETVTISILLTNDGDQSDTYRVTVKINNVPLPSQDVTVAGHTSQKVTFTTAKAVAGTYTVTIDGLSGTFAVKPGPPPPPPMAVINWWLVAAAVACIVTLVMFIWLSVKRRAMPK